MLGPSFSRCPAGESTPHSALSSRPEGNRCRAGLSWLSVWCSAFWVSDRCTWPSWRRRSAWGGLLADLFGATASTALIIAACTAVITWALVTLVFKAARFVVGLIAGALIGARLYAVFSAGGTSVVLAVVVVAATALAFGFLADRYKGRVILWATAIGGAGLIVSSLGYIWPDTLGFLHHPTAGLQQVTSTVL